MTPLERALRERIAAQGPITLEAYMEACNAYYYATRDPIGLRGDFTTAPEISQMFGEMIGAALADCWKRAGAPQGAIYAELGPGRGTLAADALRVLKSASFAGEVHLVEASPVLKGMQQKAVPNAIFHDKIEGLPARPLLLVANEFLDALPIRQHVGGFERHILVKGGGLAFDRDGEIIESSPARDDAVKAVATCISAKGGAAIVIDYGHEFTAPGDTLQAVRHHQHAPLLASPGEQDLTSHVDFEALGRIAGEAGALVTKLMGQGEWLKKLGIEARASMLERANPDRSADVRTALERLTADSQMGSLFKVIAVRSPDWPLPAGFE